jgi:hypothetical protein
VSSRRDFPDPEDSPPASDPEDSPSDRPTFGRNINDSDNDEPPIEEYNEDNYYNDNDEPTDDPPMDEPDKDEVDENMEPERPPTPESESPPPPVVVNPRAQLFGAICEGGK